MKTPYQTQQLANLPGQNVIINGNFDFWQRGTTTAATNNSALYLADRWIMNCVLASGAVQQTQSTDVPTFAQSKFSSRFSYKVTVTTVGASSPAAGDLLLPNYRVEGNDYATLHGKPVRLQFWVKNSVPGSYSVSIRNHNGSRSYLAPYTINSANTWELKMIDLTLDSVGTWAFDNTVAMIIGFPLSVGSTLSGSRLFASVSIPQVSSGSSTRRL